ncbi:hypothetical protein J5N97_005321 [Dioscorea zingiberensis]|uniref:Uncharacterized protein n=1 Tax=Dioscorea zingiberensis TaxID=325984 RepID=A0A9D5DA92_9LILI|nr:hypothetical protein J5N97_005321 [Dioscorea zingiberensis]
MDQDQDQDGLVCRAVRRRRRNVHSAVTDSGYQRKAKKKKTNWEIAFEALRDKCGTFHGVCSLDLEALNKLFKQMCHNNRDGIL